MVNGVSSTTQATKTQATNSPDNRKNEIKMEDFFKILMTQFTNQDPLEPVKDTEYISQLTQQGSYQQLLEINNTLATLQDTDKSNDSVFAASFIGKEGKFNSDHIEIINGGISEVNYNLPQQANVLVDIYDKGNNLVRTLKPGIQKTGENTVCWDGNNQKGRQLEDGSYRYKITAVSEKNQELKVDSGVTGRITGVRFEDGQVLLKVGNQEVPFSDIQELNELEDKTNI
ncbi:MAG: flagellar hook assembly protein FlgD [bacterium]